LSHPLGDVGIYSSLESPWSTSYSSQINFFRYLLWLRRYKQ